MKRHDEIAQLELLLRMRNVLLAEMAAKRVAEQVRRIADGALASTPKEPAN